MSTQVKEHPIIFSSESVKAILSGSKIQSRRVIKPQPQLSIPDETYKANMAKFNFKCPYGQVGQRLWVRETWASENRYNHLKPLEIPQIAVVFYLASTDYNPWEIGIKRPSIFMPRWASRITLEITGVRVERVQGISYDDCYAEGIDRNLPNKRQIGIGSPVFAVVTPKTYFKELWDSLNAKRGYSWQSNPFVWVISFKRIEK